MIAAEHESAMAYWTDDKIKSRVMLEKKSQRGLLARGSRPQPSVTPSASFDPDTMLTHPVMCDNNCHGNLISFTLSNFAGFFVGYVC